MLYLFVIVKLFYKTLQMIFIVLFMIIKEQSKVLFAPEVLIILQFPSGDSAFSAPELQK